MRVKFLADANLNRRIVEGLRRRETTIDFQTDDEAELAGKDDFEVLEIAARLQRVLVTHDRKTMPRAFGSFTAGHRSFGVLIVSQKLDLRSAVDELLLIWAASEADEWLNVISPVPL